MRLILFLVLILSSTVGLAQPKTEPALSSDQFANVVEQSLAMYYADMLKKQETHTNQLLQR